MAQGEVLTLDVVLVLSLTADVVVTAERTFRNIADLSEPAENLVGIASAASVGAITAAKLQARPIMRPGEVLETVPGLVISQHSGEGKANQYYLRGFNLDHGTDFATTVAGVPLNMPSGAHASGYSDSNMIIPELVSGIQFRKGPYFAEGGDFSAAGSANVSYMNLLEQPVASISTGGGRTYRRGNIADILRSNGETSTRITAFGMGYGLNLLQNFTYFLANLVDGDQFEQVDRRTSTGGKLIHRRLRQFLGRPMEWKAGTRLRHDDASVIGLYDTVRQRRTNTVREDALRQASLGGSARALGSRGQSPSLVINATEGIDLSDTENS